MNEYIRGLMDDGYIGDKGQPMKCINCGSKNLEVFDEYYEEYYKVEYSVRCKEYKHMTGTWSYGNWDIG